MFWLRNNKKKKQAPHNYLYIHLNLLKVWHYILLPFHSHQVVGLFINIPVPGPRAINMSAVVKRSAHRTTGCIDDRLLTMMTDTGFYVP